MYIYEFISVRIDSRLQYSCT